jgi:hypothetical protein
MKLPLVVTQSLGKTQLFAKRNGPTILVSAGVVGFAATTVLVGRAAIKSQPVIARLKVATDKQINEADEKGWTETQKAHVVGEIWINGGVELAKIYAPAIITGVASIACVLAAHGIMKRQQGALVAAYAALDATLRTYRDRVREELGEEKEAELYRTRNVRSYPGFDDDGLPCIINEEDPRIGSQYGRFFDETSDNWNRNAEYNRTFLLGQQRMANDRLNAYGYLFLNDVYQALGFKRSQAGQVVGWTTDGPDGYVDFGLDLIYDEQSRAFTNGLEPVVFLDFNVQGPITIPPSAELPTWKDSTSMTSIPGPLFVVLWVVFWSALFSAAFWYATSWPDRLRSEKKKSSVITWIASRTSSAITRITSSRLWLYESRILSLSRISLQPWPRSLSSSDVWFDRPTLETTGQLAMFQVQMLPNGKMIFLNSSDPESQPSSTTAPSPEDETGYKASHRRTSQISQPADQVICSPISPLGRSMEPESILQIPWTIQTPAMAERIQMEWRINQWWKHQLSIWP